MIDPLLSAQLEAELTKTEDLFRNTWIFYREAKEMAKTNHLEALLDAHSAMRELTTTERINFADVERSVQLALQRDEEGRSSE